jgi:excisionase family DNA binding protein
MLVAATTRGFRMPDVKVIGEERESFFTPRSLAKYLSVTERTIYNLLERGELASYTVASARRIDPADVDAYLAEHREERAA